MAFPVNLWPWPMPRRQPVLHAPRWPRSTARCRREVHRCPPKRPPRRPDARSAKATRPRPPQGSSCTRRCTTAANASTEARRVGKPSPSGCRRRGGRGSPSARRRVPRAGGAGEPAECRGAAGVPSAQRRWRGAEAGSRRGRPRAGAGEPVAVTSAKRRVQRQGRTAGRHRPRTSRGGVKASARRTGAGRGHPVGNRQATHKRAKRPAKGTTRSPLARGRENDFPWPS